MKSFYALTLFFLFTYSLHAQDLIEKTKANLPPTYQNVQPSQLAKWLENQQNRGFFENYSPFNIQQQSKKTATKVVSEAVWLEIKTEQLRALWEAKSPNIHLAIPVSSHQSFELELAQIQMLSDNFVLTTSDNRTFDWTTNQGVFYRGIVKGNPNSLVSLSLFEETVRILIADDGGNYVLAPMGKQKQQYILYNDKNLKKKNPFQCGMEDEHYRLDEGYTFGQTAPQRSTACLDLYMECDFATFNDLGSSLANAQDYISALFNEVSTIYQNEAITLRLSQIHVWTEVDPYAELNSTVSVLDAFGGEIKNDHNATLAHLISTRSLGGGIAWLNVVCRNYFYFYSDWDNDGEYEIHHAGPYGFTANMSTTIEEVPTYSWNVNAVAHELGHNFGSYHTQRCSWGENSNEALDDCYNTEGSCPDGPTPENGGTVMSYCHLSPSGINLNNGFGEEPGDVLRYNYNNANCLETCPESDTNLPLQLLSFEVEKIAKEQVKITWSTTNEMNLSHFELERRTNNEIWETITYQEASNNFRIVNRYFHNDKKPLQQNTFYRLKQVETNGKAFYSTIKTIEWQPSENFSINNPIGEEAVLQISSNSEKIQQLRLFDLQGQFIEEKTFQLVKGNNLLVWNMEALEKGIYFIRFSDRKSGIKLVKM